jgi:hypothetical protein
MSVVAPCNSTTQHAHVDIVEDLLLIMVNFRATNHNHHPNQVNKLASSNMHIYGTGTSTRFTEWKVKELSDRHIIPKCLLTLLNTNIDRLVLMVWYE